jgi:hypothetical protein
VGVIGEFRVLGVVADDYTDDRAEDSDCLSGRAHVVKDATGQLGGDAMVLKARDDHLWFAVIQRNSVWR